MLDLTRVETNEKLYEILLYKWSVRERETEREAERQAERQAVGA